MLDFLRVRLRQGTRTSSFPGQPAEFPSRFRGRPVLDPSRCHECGICRDALPSSLLTLGPDGRASVDLGGGLFSPEEVAGCPEGSIRYSADHRLSARERSGLVSPTGDLAAVAPLEQPARRLFGRSLRLRSVAAGSCNGCEAELVALGNVVFDMARFGVQFVASPRHADGMVITGAVSRNMREAVFRTYEAIPEPRIVIAVGACAINGGPFRGAPEVTDGVPAEIPVDLWIAGCPPHPLTVLDGLLSLLGRLDQAPRLEPAAPARAGPGPF